jgi:transcription elongation factor GreA
MEFERFFAGRRAARASTSLAGMDQSHLSPQAHRRLQDELAQRSGPGRRQISERIERAREHGDIRENADYDAAKNEQGLNEARIRQIEQILARAVVVEIGAAGDVVAAGTVVEIRMEGDDELSVYLVGSIEERHATYDVLSTGSPLGQALLGKEPGQTVIYEAPKRTFKVEIVSVRPLD